MFDSAIARATGGRGGERPAARALPREYTGGTGFDAFQGLIADVAEKEGVLPRHLAGLIDIESGFDPNAKSPAGAEGSTQFMPGTAPGYDVQYGDSAAEVRSQVEGAARYLKDLGYRKGDRAAIALAFAKYNAGPGNPGGAGSYPQDVLAASGKYRGQFAGLAGGGGSSAGGGGVRAVDPTMQRDAVQPGASGVSELLRALLEDQKPVMRSAGIAPPAFSARAATPAGYRPVEGGGGPVSSGPDVRSLLDVVRSAEGNVPPESTVTPGRVVGGGGGGGGGRSRGGGGGGGAAEFAGRYPYPTGVRGEIIGTPYSGTHTLGNWQSDNAVDIGVPFGTPIYAQTDGTISKTGGSGNFDGRFGGFNTTLSGEHNAFFYTHLSKLAVKPGERVRKGQLLGYSGKANGVEHLHLGQEHGDPQRRLSKSTLRSR
jgi:murein DD-endopeptidase MepM/ murein hydrolase activator NlpD